MVGVKKKESTIQPTRRTLQAKGTFQPQTGYVSAPSLAIREQTLTWPSWTPLFLGLALERAISPGHTGFQEEGCPPMDV